MAGGFIVLKIPRAGSGPVEVRVTSACLTLAVAGSSPARSTKARDQKSTLSCDGVLDLAYAGTSILMPGPMVEVIVALKM